MKEGLNLRIAADVMAFGEVICTGITRRTPLKMAAVERKCRRAWVMQRTRSGVCLLYGEGKCHTSHLLDCELMKFFFSHCQHKQNGQSLGDNNLDDFPAKRDFRHLCFY